MPNEISLDEKAKIKIENLREKQIINEKKQIIKAQNKILKEEKDNLEKQSEKKKQ